MQEHRNIQCDLMVQRHTGVVKLKHHELCEKRKKQFILSVRIFRSQDLKHACGLAVRRVRLQNALKKESERNWDGVFWWRSLVQSWKSKALALHSDLNMSSCLLSITLHSNNDASQCICTFWISTFHRCWTFYVWTCCYNGGRWTHNFVPAFGSLTGKIFLPGRRVLRWVITPRDKNKLLRSFYTTIGFVFCWIET